METIREKLDEIFEFANNNKLSGVIIRAGEFHKLVNPTQKIMNRVPMVCKAMWDYFKSNDVIIHEPPSGESTTLEILYKPPFGK